MRIIAVGLAAAGVVLATGFLYEQIGEYRDSSRFPRIGHAVSIGDRSLNLDCTGAGSPVVILESNVGMPGYGWTNVQRMIAPVTRVCWYDRAGMGWSDPGPFPNHSDAVAHDLHALLHAAGVPAPYVLVGHAMGAFHLRVYHGYYPSEVAGLVLVDPMLEDLTIHVHNHDERLRPTMLVVLRFMYQLGAVRLTWPNPGPPPPGWTDGQWATFWALRRQPKSLVANGQELPYFVSGELARTSGGFGDVPTIVLTAGVQDQEEDPKLDHDHALKVALQSRLARLSTRGSQIIVASGHEIPFEAPDAVAASVASVVTQIREQRPLQTR